MAGDMRLAKFGEELAVGDYLFVATAERSFAISSIEDAPAPDFLLVTLDTGLDQSWTVLVERDESCAVEVLS